VSRLIIQEPDDHPSRRWVSTDLRTCWFRPGRRDHFAGSFLPIAAICLMWIHAPKAEELTEILMAAAHAHH
jgi:hypothetical protein